MHSDGLELSALTCEASSDLPQNALGQHNMEINIGNVKYAQFLNLTFVNV